MTRRYLAYQDSGVEWLGEVPEGWGIVPVKAVATCNDEVLNDDTDPEWEIEYLEISGVDAFAGITETSKVPFGGAASRARRRVKDGDILVSTVRTYLRAIAQVIEPPENMIASTGFAVLRPRSVASKYLGYLFRSEILIGKIIARSVGVSYPAINASDIMGLPIPLPPLPEQTAIAAFLDRETAKIDGLVAEQRRLIDLLREKRQAVISHAVTRGLNAAAPLKPSGIDWLGDVPEGWEVIKLAALFRASKGPRGQTLTKEYCGQFPGEYPVYSGQTDNLGVMGSIEDFDFDAGDEGVLFSTTVGAKAMTVSHILGKFSLSQNCMIISPISEEVRPRFFFHHFQPLFAYCRSQIPDHMQPSFRMSDLYQFKIALPPKSEQEAIASTLDALSTEFDALTTTAESAIALLQERRAALISAAVTGKIDVRHLAQQETDAA